MLLPKRIKRKSRKRQPRINHFNWNLLVTCPKCKKKNLIMAKHLQVIVEPDLDGFRTYRFGVKCKYCDKTTIVVNKDKIPYIVKENVLAENTPLIVNGGGTLNNWK